MLYTMIITVALYMHDVGTDGSVSVHSVKGFSTEQACNNAKNKYLQDTLANKEYQTVVTKVVCVPMDV